MRKTHKNDGWQRMVFLPDQPGEPQSPSNPQASGFFPDDGGMASASPGASGGMSISVPPNATGLLALRVKGLIYDSNTSDTTAMFNLRRFRALSDLDGIETRLVLHETIQGKAGQSVYFDDTLAIEGELAELTKDDRLVLLVKTTGNSVIYFVGVRYVLA